MSSGKNASCAASSGRFVPPMCDRVARSPADITFYTGQMESVPGITAGASGHRCFVCASAGESLPERMVCAASMTIDRVIVDFLSTVDFWGVIDDEAPTL